MLSFILMIFEGCRQRIKRADFHKEVGAKLWNDAIPHKAHTPIVKVHADGTGSVHVSTADADLMIQISIEFGEMFYQLRAALDACIYECAVLESGKNPPPNETALQFPICPTRKHFKDAARNIAPLPVELKRLVEFVQPYNAPEVADDMKVESIQRTLFILNEWARIDRHRRLHVIGIIPTIVNPQFRLPPGTSLAWVNVTAGGGVLYDESEVATFKIDGFRVGMNIQVNPNISFEIAVNEAPLPCASNDILGERIRMMQATVESMIDSFERHYR